MKLTGPPEVLVNTIGAFEPGDLFAATPETLGQMIDVNLGAHAVAPDAIARVIVFLVSDAAAQISGAILPAYGG